jgi:hypothetical protein
MAMVFSQEEALANGTVIKKARAFPKELKLRVIPFTSGTCSAENHSDAKAGIKGKVIPAPRAKQALVSKRGKYELQRGAKRPPACNIAPMANNFFGLNLVATRPSGAVNMIIASGETEAYHAAVPLLRPYAPMISGNRGPAVAHMPPENNRTRQILAWII